MRKSKRKLPLPSQTDKTSGVRHRRRKQHRYGYTTNPIVNEILQRDSKTAAVISQVTTLLEPLCLLVVSYDGHSERD